MKIREGRSGCACVYPVVLLAFKLRLTILLLTGYQTALKLPLIVFATMGPFQWPYFGSDFMTTVQGGGSDLERVQTMLGAAARHIAPHAGDHEVNRVVSQIVGTLTPDQLRVASAGALTARVETELKASGAKGGQPFNLLSATPDQIKAAALAGHGPLSGTGWVPGPRGHAGSGGNVSSEGASSSNARGYGSISYASAGSLQAISSASFGTTPFAQAGMSYQTFSYLRNVDRSFTAQDVVRATGQNRALGFDVNDRRAQRDQATIEHYDPEARKTNDHMLALRAGLKASPEFKAAAEEYRQAKTDAQRRAVREKAVAEGNRLAKESGVHADAHDPHKPKKARDAISRQKAGTITHTFDAIVNQNLAPKATPSDSKLKERLTRENRETRIQRRADKQDSDIGTKEGQLTSRLASLRHQVGPHIHKAEHKEPKNQTAEPATGAIAQLAGLRRAVSPDPRPGAAEATPSPAKPQAPKTTSAAASGPRPA